MEMESDVAISVGSQLTLHVRQLDETARLGQERVAISREWSARAGTSKKLERYSKLADALDALRLQWESLSEVQQSSQEQIRGLVETCEMLLQQERDSWLSSSAAAKLMQGGEDDEEKEDGEGATRRAPRARRVDCLRPTNR
jgi:hypothetical protein